MKWQSRSFQARCAEQISGLTTSTVRADEHRACRPAAHGIDRDVQCKGRRRAGDIHIKGIAALDGQRLLNLDGHRRIGTLHVRRGTDHRIDLGACPAGSGQRLSASRHGHLGLQ